ncbi:hypothetical protein SLS62_007053 [Diatrype stigma]|uniref:Uncharacterized protein n=1 Tax=Diatrype stigma TaxID=117547 RepID=A0AAN9YQR1_9PEZI
MAFGYGNSGSNEMAYEMANQPCVKPEETGFANMVTLYEAWDQLKLQISSFNQIMAIPSAQFEAWSADEKATIMTLMGITFGKATVTFAFDAETPDRVFLAATEDFGKKGVSLTQNFADRGLPLMVRQQPRSTSQAASPIPGIMNHKPRKPAPAITKD